MVILACGVALWSAAHFLPSAAPEARAKAIAMAGRRPYRGAFSAVVALSLALMVWGYRGADFTPVYQPPVWGVHVNNLLMLFAVYLVGVGGMKGRLATKLRHPMLTGVFVWSAAHLLANGDQASILLFGGMGLWAAGMMWMINRRDGAWTPPEAGGLGAEIKLIFITVAIYSVIVFTHGWLLGVNPFPV